MASVTFWSSVGGDNSIVSDDTDSITGLAGYGYATRLVPALGQFVLVAQNTVNQAAAAANSAASALGAPGTNATVAGSLTVGTGSKSFTLDQTGKAYSIGQTVVIARTADPTTSMTGVITAFTASSGAMTVLVSVTAGSGTFSGWTISMGVVVSSTLPSQTGNAGRFLTTDGASASWNTSALAITNGGTGATSAATARTNLGVQASHANLTALAGLTYAADKLPYASGASTMALADFTAFARTLLDDADASTARSTLGLTIGTNVQAYDAELAAIAGLTSAADRLPYFTGSGTAALATFTSFARTLADDADAAAARGTLGAAASGLNSDITSLTGLSTPLSIGQGGTGGTTAAGAIANLGLTSLATGGFCRAVAQGRGTAGTCTTLGSSVNISSVTRTASGGVYTVTFTNAAPDTNYGVLIQCGDSASPNIAASYYSKSTAGFTLHFQGGNANQGTGAVDPAEFTVLAFY
jgi:hypothetical protein